MYYVTIRGTIQGLGIYITYEGITLINQSSTHRTPHVVSVILLTLCPTLYFISPRLFCNY